MRSITITFYPEQPITLPLTYNQYIQGMLYSCWRESLPEIHDSGYSAESKQFRMFTFSQLEGKAKINREQKTICFRESIKLEVRSPEESYLDTLAASLASAGYARLGNSMLRIVNLSTSDRLLFPQRALIRTIAPVTVHKTLEDGHTEFFTPNTSEFLEAIQNNARNKAQAFGLDNAEVQLIPLMETIKKRVVKFKSIYITGWTGDFILAADPFTMQFLYSTGLGDRNSQGFGMFEILDRPI